MDLRKKQFENLILLLCRKLGGEVRGKKKLAKLLYFVDFDLYEKEGRSLTGDTYKALPMGPVPASLAGIILDMQKEEKIDVSSFIYKPEYNPVEVFKCLVDPDESLFDSQEIEMIDRVVLKYGGLSGKELEILTHAEAPFVGTPPRGEIAYELSNYRETDFSG